MSPWTPLIKLAVGLGLIASLYGAGYWKGRITAEARCETVALKAQLAEVERQRRAAESALEAARKLADEQSFEIAGLTDQVEQYEATLAATPEPTSCALTDDDVRRLRAIK